MVVAAAMLVLTQHRELLTRDPWKIDHPMAERAAEALHDLGLKPDDRLLVLNRGLDLYTATGARPPSPYFHPTHLLAVFETPSPDPLGAALAANPRFVVLADPRVRRVIVLPERLDRARAYLARHYRPAALVHGTWDSLTIYEFAG